MTSFLALLALGSFHVQNSTEVPPWLHRSGTQSNIEQFKRGTVTLFDDSFGDPTPAAITEGPDGALWFTDPGNDVIGRVTPSGHYSEFQVGAELSNGIVTAPDGALWFTVEQSEGGIGRITTDGTVSLLNDPGGSFPQDITVGPDNALWFTESNGQVGRISLHGNVQHFTVAPTNATLAGIVTGPDGALWATEALVGSHNANHVIRLTTTGKTKTFSVGGGPNGICVGPDRELWFTESEVPAIGRLTTTGKYTEVALHGALVQPADITAGPDGALWFTDFGGKGVGRLTLGGKVNVFAVAGSLPTLDGITAGPRNSMWFTSEMFPTAVGRVTVR